MKKGILLLTAIAAFSFANAQTIEKPLKNLKLQPSADAKVEVKQGNTNDRRDAYDNWYLPYNAYWASVSGDNMNTSIMIMHPDSNLVKVNEFENEVSASQAGVHMTGNVIDFGDEIFAYANPPLEQLSKFNSVSLDSLFFRFGYYRAVDSMMVNGTQTKIIDTLYIQYYNNTNLKLAGLRWTGGDNAGETERYGHPSSFDPERSMATNSIKVDTLFLDENDSSLTGDGGWFSKGFQIPVGINYTVDNMSNTANVVGYSFTFRPMKPSVFGDTMYNSADDRFPNIYDGIQNRYNYAATNIVVNAGDDILQTNYYNNMFLVNTQLKYYGAGSGSIFDRYYPGLIYNSRYYHQSGVKISTQNLGVEDLDASGFGLGYAYPNPANSGDEVKVDFELGHSADATISLTDINGRVLSTVSNHFGQGAQYAILPTTNLAPGMYLYNVTSGNFTATKKLIIK